MAAHVSYSENFGLFPKAPAAAKSCSSRAKAAAGNYSPLISVARAIVVALFGVLSSGCALAVNNEGVNSFVVVEDGQFKVDGEKYAFAGVNMWYAAYLGASAQYGDRDRLVEELNALQSIGVTNIRILGASEASPFAKSLKETFRDNTYGYNEALLKGLDFALAEMAKRDMRAVIYLNNFWEWSGGMGTYLYWVNGGEFVDLGDPKHPWPAFQNFTAQFYGDEEANALYLEYVQAVVTRANTITGVSYRDDPTIMAWQLANEPRPGASFEEGDTGLAEFYRWVDETARFIKELDANHLVSSGNEGFMGCNEIDSCFVDAHQSPAIDYLTFHIWPRNWGWMNFEQPDEAFANTTENTKAYIDRHIAYAERLHKPIVLEEFGFDRDGGANSPAASVLFRNQYLSLVYAEIEKSLAKEGPFAGSNIWAWGGYGTAQHPDYLWREGDTSFTGDPPQEPQGRNSVFASDQSTLAIIKAHANNLP